ncbi:Ribonuclease H domain [Sesbania bispinosa]|nr:Ribonuclease H domain [Sesbania bispinosa]
MRIEEVEEDNGQREAAKALAKVIQSKGGELSAMNAPLTRLARSHATAIIFREPAVIESGFCHNRPLYVEAKIEGIKVRRALVDNGSGVNILPTHLFRMLNIPKLRMRILDITLNTFHGKPLETRGLCVNAVLEVGPIRPVNVFQVVESDPSYQAHLIDASLFDEVAPPGSGRIVKEHHVLLDPSRRPQKKGSFPHPMPTHKRKSENGVEKEYLPNGEGVFEKIKRTMTSMPVMIYPDPGKPLRLYLAVTDKAINGLIAQESHGGECPVCYLSRLLKDVEARYRSKKEGEVFTLSYHIGFPCTNSEAEYEALILGLRMVRDLNVKHLKIKGDSNLIIKQLKGEYGVKEASLAAYRDEALKLTEAFEGIEASHIPRAENRHADALATIRSKETRSEGEEVVVFRRLKQPSVMILQGEEIRAD